MLTIRPLLNFSIADIFSGSILCPDGWKKEQKKFCPFCNSTYDTMSEAKSACEEDQDCNVIYDLFCDDIGYFCICPFVFVVEQTHPKGVDCIYVKPNA
jgi:hypothetical protein